MSLKSSLNALKVAAASIGKSEGFKQMAALSAIDKQAMDAEIVKRCRVLEADFKEAVLESYYAANVNEHTGTMLKSFENARVDFQPRKISVRLSSENYPNGRGNCFAAMWQLKKKNPVLFSLIESELAVLQDKYGELVKQVAIDFGVPITGGK